jgi:EAL domain-containing protein (putative c-di-GMP-specific phosphodiesterase class I)/ActR/RegA family two-component response regulator
MLLEDAPDTGEFPAPSWPQSADVLVVDDDPVVRKLIVTMLQAAGLTTYEATSGREGVEKLRERTFDVIVSDVDMPDGTGIDLLREVRQVDLDIPVILVTGKPDVRSASQAVEYGAFRYMTKPIRFDELVSSIRKGARARALARVRREALSIGGADAAMPTDRAGLEVRFASAIEKLWTAFQPIVGARSGALFGVEALLRTDEVSMPSPGAVLDAAGKLGRLGELGRLTRRRAAEALGPERRGMFLFVNLHPDDLFDDDLIAPDTLLARIATRVVLEITERASLKATQALEERLTGLRALGFRFAIDDIGAGYSGLTSFAEVAPEVVKIDMALVRNVHKSEIRQRTIRSLSTLCHDCGSLVVGEGVETAEERDCLEELGCDLLQGYFFARPARELPRWRSSETLATIG